MNTNTIKIMISAFCLLVTLFPNALYGTESHDKIYQLEKELSLCNFHLKNLTSSFIGSDEKHVKTLSGSEVCHVCKDIYNISNNTGNEIKDAYYKYEKQLFEHGHITLIDLLHIENEINKYKMQYPIKHFQQ